MCPICKGSGEVSAGITGGIVYYGKPDRNRDKQCFPTTVKVNPKAFDSRINDVWIVRENPLVYLWGIAICIRCHGTGQVLPSL